MFKSILRRFSSITSKYLIIPIETRPTRSQINLELMDEDMTKSINWITETFSKIKNGRISSLTIEDIFVKTANLPLSKLGTFMHKDGTQTLTMIVNDPRNSKSISSSLQSANMNLVASIEGSGSKVLITFPKQTKDSKAILAKSLSLKVDGCKKILRNIRNEVDKANKTSILDLNLRRQNLIELDRIFKQHMKKLETILVEKQKEVLSSS